MKKNLVYTLSSQGVSIILGILKVLILPFILGIEEFGYWQVYLLYVGYLGILSFGFNDGIMLKYGSLNNNQLPKPLLRSSIQIFFFFQLFIGSLIGVIFLLETNPNKLFAFFFVAINIPIVGLTGVLNYILQSTNQLKKFSILFIIDKVIVIIAILIMWKLNVGNFQMIILFDTVSKAIALFIMMYYCRDLFKGKKVKFNEGYLEFKQSILVGIKVMVSNFLSMLILGYSMFLIERSRGIEEFSVYSFSITTTNLILVFSTALGTVIFPFISRRSEDLNKEIFSIISKLSSFAIIFLYIIYFPIRFIIETFLIEFQAALTYLPFIYLFIFSQSKMQLLINPYYKRLREETEMLYANLKVFIVSFLLVSVTFIIYKSILIVVVCIALSMFLRLILSELYLKKKLDIQKNIFSLFDIISILVFLICASQPDVYIGFLLYMLFLTILIIYKKERIISLYKQVTNS